MMDGKLESGSLSEREKSAVRHVLRNARVLGVCFCLVFMSFSAAQNSQTSDAHKHEGSIALGIVYTVFTLTNFVSPYILTTIGLRRSLLVGSIAYMCFVAANITYFPYTLFPAAFLLGLGACVIWTAQGAYITRCATVYAHILRMPPASSMGRFNGRFWAFFQTNQCVGNLIVALLYTFDVAHTTTFIAMTGLCAVGAVGLLFLDDVPTFVREISCPDLTVDIEASRGDIEEDEDTASVSVASVHTPIEFTPPLGAVDASNEEAAMGSAPLLLDEPVIASYDSAGDLPDSKEEPGVVPLAVKRSVCGAVWDMLHDVRMLLLIPLFIFSGISQTYIFGEFPPLIKDNSLKFFCLSCFGFFDALCSRIFGRISDNQRVISDEEGRLIQQSPSDAKHIQAGATERKPSAERTAPSVSKRLSILFMGALAFGAVMVFLMAYEIPQPGHPGKKGRDGVSWHGGATSYALFFVVAMVLGVGDAAFNTQICAVLGTYFPEDPEAAFSVFKLFQAGSTAAMFFYRVMLSFDVKSVIALSFLVTGMSLMFVANQVIACHARRTAAVQ